MIKWKRVSRGSESRGLSFEKNEQDGSRVNLLIDRKQLAQIVIREIRTSVMSVCNERRGLVATRTFVVVVVVVIVFVLKLVGIPVAT